MDLNTLFQSMTGGASGADNTAGKTASQAAEAVKNAFSSGGSEILQNMMQGSPSGDILKNMMSDSQKELYEKFNERFQNL